MKTDGLYSYVPKHAHGTPFERQTNQTLEASQNFNNQIEKEIHSHCCNKAEGFHPIAAEKKNVFPREKKKLCSSKNFGLQQPRKFAKGSKQNPSILYNHHSIINDSPTQQDS